MFFLTHNQDQIIKDTANIDLINYNAGYKKLVFMLDLVLVCKDLSTKSDLLNLVTSFTVLYELFYFFSGQKFFLSTIFFYNSSAKKSFFCSFLYEEKRPKFLQAYVSFLTVYRALFRAFSSLYEQLSVSLDYRILDSNKLSFKFNNLLDYFFCFKPELLGRFKNSCMNCRILLDLDSGGSKERFELFVLVTNSVDLNYNEVKDI